MKSAGWTLLVLAACAVEWRRDGKVVTTTSGHEPSWRRPYDARLVHDAHDHPATAVTAAFSVADRQRLSYEEMQRVSDRIHRETAREADTENAARKARRRALRPELLRMIEVHGAPCKLDEMPR